MGKKRKMPIKSLNMKISKNTKMPFFLISQGLLTPKIMFLGQKLCSVARIQRHDRHTDRYESGNCGHLFRVSGVFPSTYHQGSAQLTMKLHFSMTRFLRWPPFHKILDLK